MLTQEQKEANGFLIANYGIAMFNAQTLEQAIAVLCMSIRFGKLKDYPEPGRNVAEARKLFDRFWKDFQTQSVGAQRPFLAKHLAPDIYADIDEWIGRRNELAHRFLVRHYIAVGSKAHTFKPGTFETIVTFADDCKPLEKRVFDEASRRVAQAKIPQSVRDMGAEFVLTVMQRDDWPE